jgi:hypothetical protein
MPSGRMSLPQRRRLLMNHLCALCTAGKPGVCCPLKALERSVGSQQFHGWLLGV